MKYLTRIHYFAKSGGSWAEHEIDYILFSKNKTNALPMEPNPEEVKNVMYLKMNDLEAFIKDVGEESVTPWFLLMAKTQLPNWWANIDDLDQFVDHETIMRHWKIRILRALILIIWGKFFIIDNKFVALLFRLEDLD